MTLEEIGLVKSCPDCDGTGMKQVPDILGDDRLIYCGRCNGNGDVPTEEGKRLIRFMETWMNRNV